jgi:hypothetical protein
LLPLLSDPAYAAAAPGIASAIKAVATKLRGDMPHCAELVQCMLNLLTPDMGWEEPLMAISALLLCGGQEQLQHFGMAIHGFAIEAIESDNETLSAIGYCVLGDVFVALPLAMRPLADESIEKVLGKCEIAGTVPTIPIVKAISLIMRGAPTTITGRSRERVVALFARMIDPGRFGQDFEEELATATNLIRAFSNIVIGYRQNQAFLTQVAKLAFNFVQTIWNIKLLSDEVLHELYDVFRRLGEALQQRVNVQLNKRHIRELVRLGAESQNENLQSEATAIGAFLEDL